MGGKSLVIENNYIYTNVKAGVEYSSKVKREEFNFQAPINLYGYVLNDINGVYYVVVLQPILIRNPTGLTEKSKDDYDDFKLKI